MSSMFDKLEMRPNERRLVVGVGIVVFIVLNVWFVWPHFDDWKEVLNQTAKARKTLGTYRAEIGKIPEYQTQLAKLEQSGTEVATEEQALHLQRIVESEARANGVVITSSKHLTRQSTTNQFFDQNSLTINIVTGNKELVDFLYKLASGSSMIQVRSLNIQPDQSQTRLQGWITCTASYQKPDAAAPSPAASRAVTAKRTP